MRDIKDMKDNLNRIENRHRHGYDQTIEDSLFRCILAIYAKATFGLCL